MDICNDVLHLLTNCVKFTLQYLQFESIYCAHYTVNFFWLWNSAFVRTVLVHSGRVRKISPPPDFGYRTVRSTSSHYTEYSVSAAHESILCINVQYSILFHRSERFTGLRSMKKINYVRIPFIWDMNLCDLLIPEDEDTTFLRYVGKHSPQTVQHDIPECLNSQKQRCENLRSRRIEVECIVIKFA
jgi:hypothetical protein